MIANSLVGFEATLDQSTKPMTIATCVNASGVSCIRNPQGHLAVRSVTNSKARTYTLHGQQHVFSNLQVDPLQQQDPLDPVTLAKKSSLALAQSPDMQHAPTANSTSKSTPDALQRNPVNEWLLFAIQSKRKNLLQFVSRVSHRDGQNGPEVPLYNQLAAQFENSVDNPVRIKLDDCHTIVGFKPLAEEWIPNVNGQAAVGRKSADIVIEIKEPDGTIRTRRIALTQVAPPFQKRLLKAEDLTTVHKICNDQQMDMDGTIAFSYAGVGRNATLAVYDQLVKAIRNGKIDSADDLEDLLKTLVTSGRSTYHQHFVHSDEQLLEIFKAAHAQWEASKPPSVLFDDLPAVQTEPLTQSGFTRGPDLTARTLEKSVGSPLGSTHTLQPVFPSEIQPFQTTPQQSNYSEPKQLTQAELDWPLATYLQTSQPNPTHNWTLDTPAHTLQNLVRSLSQYSSMNSGFGDKHDDTDYIDDFSSQPFDYRENSGL